MNANFSLGNDEFPAQQIASILTPAIQELFILPTEQCNFRCTYCYEDFAIGKMSETTIKSLERYIDRRVESLKVLKIEWFGGEPLVARDVVLRLLRHAKARCDEHEVSLISGMTTNAFLLSPDLFTELVHLEQRSFQITLDGWGAGHDVVRRLANGKSTFDRIWQNLLAMRDVSEQFSIVLRIHVRRDNRSSLEKLVEEIADNFGDDSRFSLDFEHLRDLGGEGGQTVLNPVSMKELKEIESDLRRRAANRGEFDCASANGESPSGSTAPAPRYICYAAKPNSLLIRADGRIGKCTVALNDDRNTIGRVNPDGSLSIDNSKLQPWVRGVGTLEPRDLACPLSDMTQALVNQRSAESVA
ncbi:radical SAM protein [Sphingomonas suaedae]|uniref:Radical SAM protein n=1 Tax=Sphingomonas suaedae TaxID=2599297 RepID=A0A518RB73_9SPHN|nr:radical SAM protein [Sphingomonas suaedae]QDX24708.1 radical SAM protein [Sphingomonas suaedae]